jgi:hypothetical protein
MRIIREPISRRQPKTLANSDIRSIGRGFPTTSGSIQMLVRDSAYDYFVTLKRDEIFRALHAAIDLSKLDTASSALASAAIGILVAIIPETYPQ